MSPESALLRLPKSNCTGRKYGLASVVFYELRRQGRLDNVGYELTEELGMGAGACEIKFDRERRFFELSREYVNSFKTEGDKISQPAVLPGCRFRWWNWGLACPSNAHSRNLLSVGSASITLRCRVGRTTSDNSPISLYHLTDDLHYLLIRKFVVIDALPGAPLAKLLLGSLIQARACFGTVALLKPEIHALDGGQSLHQFLSLHSTADQHTDIAFPQPICFLQLLETRYYRAGW